MPSTKVLLKKGTDNFLVLTYCREDFGCFGCMFASKDCAERELIGLRN